jgi:hypothetical protein
VTRSRDAHAVERAVQALEAMLQGLGVAPQRIDDEKSG